MKKKLLIAGVVLLGSCQQTDPTNPTTPVVTVSPTPVPTPGNTNPICPAYAPDNDKYMIANYYALEQMDVTPRVKNRSYCEVLYGVSGPFDCKANVNGEFPGCDVEFLNGLHCPQWFYQDPFFGFWLKCTPKGDDQASCDHFDGYSGVGAYTGNCEKDKNGVPITGFLMTPHGNTSFKACDKTMTICSNPLRANH